MTWLLLHPQASEELAEASDWYEVQRASFGARFLKSFADAVALLREYPESGTAIGRGSGGIEVRALLMKGFPARVIYSPLKDGVFVISIAHTSRRVGYWRWRLKDVGR